MDMKREQDEYESNDIRKHCSEEFRNDFIIPDDCIKQESPFRANWYSEVKPENSKEIMSPGTLNVEECQGIFGERRTNDAYVKNEPYDYEISGRRSHMRSNEPLVIIKLRRMQFFERNFVCAVCFSVFPSSDENKLHRSVHNDSTHTNIVYECDLCFHIFSSSSLLNEHNLIHSGNKSDNHRCTEINSAISKSNETITNGERRFKCDECNYAGKHFYQLKKHKNVHSEPLICEECKYTALTPSKLKAHKVIHFEDRPYKCNICKYTGKRACDLKVHRLTHSADKPFKCDHCDYESIRLSHLIDHKMTHSGEKPFKCGECSYASSRMFSLKLHKRTHFRVMKSKREYRSPGINLIKRNNAVRSEGLHLNCDECCYTSNSLASFNLHKMTHFNSTSLMPKANTEKNTFASMSSLSKSQDVPGQINSIDVFEDSFEDDRKKVNQEVCVEERIDNAFSFIKSEQPEYEISITETDLSDDKSSIQPIALSIESAPSGDSV